MLNIYQEIDNFYKKYPLSNKKKLSQRFLFKKRKAGERLVVHLIISSSLLLVSVLYFSLKSFKGEMVSSLIIIVPFLVVLFPFLIFILYWKIRSKQEYISNFTELDTIDLKKEIYINTNFEYSSEYLDYLIESADIEKNNIQKTEDLRKFEIDSVFKIIGFILSSCVFIWGMVMYSKDNKKGLLGATYLEESYDFIKGICLLILCIVVYINIFYPSIRKYTFYAEIREKLDSFKDDLRYIKLLNKKYIDIKK